MLKPELVEKIIILFTTAFVSGLIVPLTLRIIDEQRTKELKKREALIARQSQLIEEQSQFLDELTQVLWNWRYAAMQVTYYAARKQLDMYENVLNKYQESIWKYLNSFRYLTSKSRRLITSDSIYKKLLKFYFKIVNFDREIHIANNIEIEGQKQFRFRSLNSKILNEVSTEIDEILLEISKQLKLYPE